MHPGLSLALALAPARDSSPTLAAPFSAPAVPARRRPLRSAPRPAAPMQLAQFGRTEKRSVQGHQALQHRIDPPQFCVRGAKKSKHSRCHSVFATSCALNVPATASARPSSPLIKPASGSRPIVAYAHSVFATPCALNVPTSASARPSSSLIKPAPGSRPIVAYAHSVFATFCAFLAQE